MHSSSTAPSGMGMTTAQPRRLHEPVGAVRERRQLETTALWERISSSQSEEERALLREEVVLLNMSVAQAIASRYGSRGILLEDLQQVAFLELVKAAKGFDPALQKDFLSYAVPTIRGRSSATSATLAGRCDHRDGSRSCSHGSARPPRTPPRAWAERPDPPRSPHTSEWTSETSSRP